MTEIHCTCRPQEGRGGRAVLHSIDCLTEAATQPHAMVNDELEVFYPDNPDDAAHFVHEYGARFLDPGFTWKEPRGARG